MESNRNYIPMDSLLKVDTDLSQKTGSRIYIETYGCQMNLADTEVVYGIMNKNGFNTSEDIKNSDIVLLNTCSVRDNAEARIYQRLSEIKYLKKKRPEMIFGIIGCMAERLKKDIVNKSKVVDLIVGPDEYRKLPGLIDNLVNNGEKGIAVRLSRVETYDDITPVRKDGISAWLSVMRGCDKFCSFCVVPYTRGRERSRALESIVAEVKQLEQDGFREITLLGQNVNSYFSHGSDFADLLSACANAVCEMRIRFTTSHPEDMSDKLIETIVSYPNLCKYIHLPVQSGSDRILDLMKRSYTIEHYMKRIDKIKSIMPDASISTDIISGFPTETDEDHAMTLDIMKEVKYDGAYMFKYSPREHTKAFLMKDDVNEETKTKRLMEIIELQNNISAEINKNSIGKEFDIFIDSVSKKSKDMLTGRTDGNKKVIIPKDGYAIGDLVKVKIIKANSATLFGELIK
jgi:tRNA-2-methylthio-N6-dimethylallyladenosine synthase